MKKLILIIFTIHILLVSFTKNSFSEDYILGGPDEKYTKIIYNLIINENYKELLNYFDDEITLVSVDIFKPYKTFYKKDNYGGFNNGKGLLYSVIFNINTADNSYKNKLLSKNILSFKDVFKNLIGNYKFRKGPCTIIKEINKDKCISGMGVRFIEKNKSSDYDLSENKYFLTLIKDEKCNYKIRGFEIGKDNIQTFKKKTVK